MNDYQVALCIERQELPVNNNERDELCVKLLKLVNQQLAVDNSHLRESHNFSLIGARATLKGAGYPDGYIYDLTKMIERPVDNKSGNDAVFPDGGVKRHRIGIDEDAINKKARENWLITVGKNTSKGTVYVCGFDMSDAFEDLRADLVRLRANPNTNRFSPKVSQTQWLSYPSTVCLYKRVELFERQAIRGGLKRMYQRIHDLPYKPGYYIQSDS
jgi:hypothetical protein